MKDRARFARPICRDQNVPILSYEGRLSGHHLVNHFAEGKDVTARIAFLALQLLGCQVSNCFGRGFFTYRRRAGDFG